jgi:hypothetical protein
MKSESWSSERRREVRTEAAGRIAWRTAPGQPPVRPPAEHVGWLSDRSRSSVSFITATATQPSFGQQIEVCSGGGRRRQRQRWRVARTAPYDDQLSLVACTTISPECR